MANKATSEWSVADMKLYKASGGILVAADGWSVGYITGDGINGARLSLVKYRPGAAWEAPVEIDPKDGHEFPSMDDAQCYALNRGTLEWYVGSRSH